MAMTMGKEDSSLQLANSVVLAIPADGQGIKKKSVVRLKFLVSEERRARRKQAEKELNRIQQRRTTVPRRVPDVKISKKLEKLPMTSLVPEINAVSSNKGRGGGDIQVDDSKRNVLPDDFQTNGVNPAIVKGKRDDRDSKNFDAGSEKSCSFDLIDLENKASSLQCAKATTMPTAAMAIPSVHDHGTIESFLAKKYRVSEERKAKRKRAEEELNRQETRRNKIPRQVPNVKSSSKPLPKLAISKAKRDNFNAGLEKSSSFDLVNLEIKKGRYDHAESPYVMFDEHLFPDDRFHNLKPNLENAEDLLVGPLFDVENHRQALTKNLNIVSHEFKFDDDSWIDAL